MLKIVGIMLCGVLVGYGCRNRQMKMVPLLILLAIWILLFFLGMAVGSNEEILKNLPVIGGQALLLSIGGVGGSVVLAWVVYKFFFFPADSGSSQKSDPE